MTARITTTFCISLNINIGQLMQNRRIHAVFEARQLAFISQHRHGLDFQATMIVML